LSTPIDPRIGPAIGGCGCISSYIRDWQVPLTQLDALIEAIDHRTKSIAFLLKRDGDKANVAWERQRIEQCQAIVDSGCILEEYNNPQALVDWLHGLRGGVSFEVFMIVMGLIAKHDGKLALAVEKQANVTIKGHCGPSWTLNSLHQC